MSESEPDPIVKEALEYIAGTRTKKGRPSNEVLETADLLKKSQQQSRIFELMQNPELLATLESLDKTFDTIEPNKEKKESQLTSIFKLLQSKTIEELVENISKFGGFAIPAMSALGLLWYIESEQIKERTLPAETKTIEKQVDDLTKPIYDRVRQSKNIEREIIGYEQKTITVTEEVSYISPFHLPFEVPEILHSIVSIFQLLNTLLRITTLTIDQIRLFLGGRPVESTIKDIATKVEENRTGANTVSPQEVLNDPIGALFKQLLKTVF